MNDERMNTMLAQRIHRIVAAAVLCLIGVVPLPAVATADSVVRTVHGTVLAVNIRDTPQTIVVQVILPDKQEMIVGADVPPEVGITKGKQPVGLADIKTGAHVAMTYIKNPQGLVARSIHLD